MSWERKSRSREKERSSRARYSLLVTREASPQKSDVPSRGRYSLSREQDSVPRVRECSPRARESLSRKRVEAVRERKVTFQKDKAKSRERGTNTTEDSRAESRDIGKGAVPKTGRSSRCWNCDREGHYMRDCREKPRDRCRQCGAPRQTLNTRSRGKGNEGRRRYDCPCERLCSERKRN